MEYKSIRKIISNGVNKKTLFLILLTLILLHPLVALAAVPDMVLKIKDAAVTIGTYIVIIGWIIAGILYLTSAGSPEKLKIAKGALVSAVVGTILIILAATAEKTIKELLGV